MITKLLEDMKLTRLVPTLLFPALLLGTGCSRHAGEDDHTHEGEPPGAHAEEAHATDAEAHGAHAGEEIVHLTAEQLTEFDIQVAEAGPGKLALTLSLPGEVVYDPGRLAHVVPRVPGIAREVFKTVGDTVRSNDVLAVLESKELAAAKASYLAAVERVKLGEATFDRERRLRERNISSEREYLAAQTMLAEARIARRSAEHALHALGFTPEYVSALTPESEALSRYEIHAPISGIVVQRHLTLGEKVDGTEPVFTVADLSTIWVQLSVYQKDLDHVRSGQAVTVREAQGRHTAEARIDYISPIVDEATRTASARLIVPNADGTWRPGQFVTGEVQLETVEVPLAVPREAVLTHEDQPVVFVQTDEGFERRAVHTGRSDPRRVEILDGLRVGERLVVKNAFTLKAELGKGSMETGHSH